jgi:hypothetical protein
MGYSAGCRNATLVEELRFRLMIGVVCDGAATKKRSMNYYVGLDVCLKETSVCIGSNPMIFSIRSPVCAQPSMFVWS